LLDRGTSITQRPSWFHLTLDTSALLYLAIISVATGILFGLAPALRLAKSNVNAALNEGGGYGVVGNRVGFHLSDVLVAAQMAICVVLLTGAGLLIRSAVNLYSTPIGVNTANVLTMRVNLPEKKYAGPESWVQFYGDLRKRLTALPGVELTTLASNLPLGGWASFPVEFQRKPNDEDELPELGALIVGNNYFQAFQVGARRGRLFTDADGVSGPPVIIVNESFAAKFWPHGDALGQRLRLVDDSPGPWLTIVGIVPDILQNSRNNLEHNSMLYVPFVEKPQRQVFVAARTGVSPGSLTAAFRREVQRADENLAVYDLRTLDQRIAENRLGPALFGAMFSIFAAVATILAAIGLYAVVAHAVSQRTREIGLRIALGATPCDIARLVFGQAIRPLVPGLVIGILLALAVGRFLPFVLAGVSRNDPLTFSAILAVLITAAALGCLVPARRAARVEPVSALRCS
jgi:putative ABC transport system permease protein